jgi:hypothetical protein
LNRFLFAGVREKKSKKKMTSSQSTFLEFSSSHRDRAHFPEPADFIVPFSTTSNSNENLLTFKDPASTTSLVIPQTSPATSASARGGAVVVNPWNLFVLNFHQRSLRGDQTFPVETSVPAIRSAEIKVRILQLSNTRNSFYIQGVVQSELPPNPNTTELLQESNILSPLENFYVGATFCENSAFAAANRAREIVRGTIVEYKYFGNNVAVIVLDVPLLLDNLNVPFFIYTETKPGLSGAVTPASTGRIFVPASSSLPNAYVGMEIVNETRQESRKIVQYDSFAHLVTTDEQTEDWQIFDTVSIRERSPTAYVDIGYDNDGAVGSVQPNILQKPSRDVFVYSHLSQNALAAGAVPRNGDFVEALFGRAISIDLTNIALAANATTITLTNANVGDFVGVNVGDRIVGLSPQTQPKFAVGTTITAFEFDAGAGAGTITFFPGTLAEIVTDDRFAIMGGGGKPFAATLQPGASTTTQLVLDAAHRPSSRDAYVGFQVLIPNGSTTNFLVQHQLEQIVGGAIVYQGHTGVGSINDGDSRQPAIVTAYDETTGALTISPPLSAAPGSTNAYGELLVNFIPYRQIRQVRKFHQFSGLVSSMTTTTVQLPVRSQHPFRGSASRERSAYVDLVIRVTRDAAVAVPQWETRIVTRYNPDTRVVTVSSPFTFADGSVFEINSGKTVQLFSSPLIVESLSGWQPAPGATLARARFVQEGILSATQSDNAQSLLYSGSLVSVSQDVCYRISLVELVVPNLPILTGAGGRLAFYPYIYVDFENVSSSNSGRRAILYSNNPTATLQTFRCPITDIDDPFQASFLKLSSAGQTITAKFKPTDSFRLTLRLPNGDIFKTVGSETSPPSLPNETKQISYLFRITRLPG